jgi:5-carboxymethyl-2-hydroxymuconate isomerase
MPHCILEYSTNLEALPDWVEVFEDVHAFLVGTGLFLLDDIKSRAVGREHFLVADGAPARAFVAMNVCILDGRDDEVKALVSEGVLEVLKRHLRTTCEGKRCSISVRITEMERSSYQRWASSG